MRTVLVWLVFFYCCFSASHGNNSSNITRGKVHDAYKVVFTNTKAENTEYFFELFGKLMHRGAKSLPFVGNAYGELTQFISDFTKGEQKSLFEQIEDQVKGAIRNELTTYHFDNMIKTKNLINDYIKENLLDKNVWLQIKNSKFSFLPQIYSSLAYTRRFFPEWKAYTIIFIATTYDLIAGGILDKCEMVEQLKKLKIDFVNGIKSLQLKRWQMLEGYSYRRSPFKDDYLHFKDTYTRKKICDSTARHQDKCSPRRSLGNTLYSVGRRVVEDSRDFIKDFNLMLKSVEKGGQYCFKESCNCPKKLKIEEAALISYMPKKCMGSKDGKDCKFPCDTYGYSSNWCTVPDSMRNIQIRMASWMYCNKPDWSRCYPIPTP